MIRRTVRTVLFACGAALLPAACVITSSDGDDDGSGGSGGDGGSSGSGGSGGMDASSTGGTGGTGTGGAAGSGATGGSAGYSGGAGYSGAAGGAGWAGAAGGAGWAGAAGGAGTAGAAGGDAGPPRMVPECVGEDLGSNLGMVASGDLTAETNDIDPTCGFSFGGTNDAGTTGSPDKIFYFTAPQDGIYVIDTIGSDFDTILDVLDGCPADAPDGGADAGGDAGTGPTSLACNETSNGEDTSSLPISLSAGQSIVIVLDSEDGGGNYQLNINLGVCPQEDLMSALGTPVTSGDSSMNPNVFNSEICGAGSWPDATFKWTAPADGSYTFDLGSTAGFPVLEILDGEGCGGMPLATCETGSTPITLTLTMGQVVTVVIDAVGSPPSTYELNIVQN